MLQMDLLLVGIFYLSICLLKEDVHTFSKKLNNQYLGNANQINIKYNRNFV